MLFEDTYFTISKQGTGTFRDRSSKFIGLIYYVKTEEEIKDILAQLKKDYYDATHHCYAYRLGFDKLKYRVNDDGEPSGSAGKPIFGQIQSKDLTDVLIVVVRYFGGTLLGVGGLINAYRTTAANAIADTQIIEKTVQEIYELSFAYVVMNDVMKVLKNDYIKQLSQQFDLDCKLVFSVRKNNADSMLERFKKIESCEIKYIRTE